MDVCWKGNFTRAIKSGQQIVFIIKRRLCTYVTSMLWKDIEHYGFSKTGVTNNMVQ